MEIMREDAFRKQLKSGLSGGYLFYGDEDYLKAHALRAARQAVAADEGLAVFNDVRLDAMDFSALSLLEALQPLPMMEDRKIVTVTGLSISSLKPRELDELCDALDALSEYDYNVLILSVPSGEIEEGTPKRPSAILGRLGKYLIPVLFESIAGARLAAWVGKHFAACGVKAAPDVCAYLIEYSGRSMYTLAAETEKLSYYVLQNGRSEVTREDVKQVSVGVIETDAYALANAVLDGRPEKALEALSVMKFQRVEPIIILSEVSRVICDMLSVKSLLERGTPQSEIARVLKMNEYKAKLYVGAVAAKPTGRFKRALSMCAEADLALKLSPQGYQAIERLICGL